MSQDITNHDKLLGRLVDKTEELNEVGRDLAKSALLSRAQRMALLIMAGVILMVCGLVIWQILELRTSSGYNRALLSTIEDCLNPTGNCYKQGRENQDNSIDLINRFTEAATVCGKLEVDEPSIRRCIQERTQ